MFNIIFIVHLSKFFENHELINTRVHKFTSCFFTRPQCLLLFSERMTVLLQVMVECWQQVVVLLLSLLLKSDLVQHRGVQGQTLLKRHKSMQFQLLVVVQKLFRTFACVKVPLSRVQKQCIIRFHLS